MKTTLNFILALVLIISVGNLSAAPTDGSGHSEETAKALKTLRKSSDAFENIMEDPDCAIPQRLIDQSEGIVIFPGAFKVAIGALGGQGGRGIAMVRKDDGTWSNPFIVILGEGSLGIQIGAQSSEIVLLFKDRDDILEIDDGEIMLGSDVGVIAGPASNTSSENTDIRFEREIYAYHRSKGLFAGVNLAGGVLTYNVELNSSLYGVGGYSAEEILYEMDTPFNEEVNELIGTISRYGQQD